MGFNEFIKRLKFAFSDADLEQLAEQGAEEVKKNVQEAKESDKDIESIAEMAYEQYQALTKNMSKEQKGEFAKKYANFLVEKKGIPFDIAYNYIIMMTGEKEVDNKYVIEPAKKLPDAKVSKLISEDDAQFSLEDKLELAKGGIQNPDLKDEKLEEIEEEKREKQRKEEIADLNSLESVYRRCDENIGDWQLVEEINKKMQMVRRVTPKIEEMKRKIVAKKIACNYAKNGTSTVYILANVIPAIEMGKINMPELARREYETIEKNPNSLKIKSMKKFNEQELRDNILAEVESEAEKKFNETEAFTELESMLKILSVEERKRQIEGLKDIIRDSKLRATVEQTKGLVKELSKIPEEKRLKVISSIQGIVEERNEKNISHSNSSGVSQSDDDEKLR